MSCYYAMYGKNGLGVYNDPLKSEKAIEYFIDPKVKKLSSKSAAVKLAKERYNRILQDDFAISGYYNDADMRLNWLYYRKNL